MDRNINNSACCPGEEIVSYLYDEMPADVRARFEDHLASCTVCTDEFAEISDSRFSVYEWNKIEFAQIPTPVFAIRPQDPEQTGWLERLTGLISLTPAWTRFAVAGAIIVVFGSVMLFRSELASDVTLTADIPAVISEVQKPDLSAATPALPAAENIPTKIDEAPEAKAYVPSRNTKSASKSRKSRSTGSNRVETASRRNFVPRSAPRLTNVDIEEETSLRLADLLAEVEANE